MRKRISGADGYTPREEIRRLDEEAKRAEEENRGLSAELSKAAKSRKRLELHCDRLILKREKYRAFCAAENTERTFAITGYIPKNALKKTENELSEKFGAALETEETENDETLPVYFKNNAFAEPMERITEGYSAPSARDIDPSTVTAVFYYWFFGMMFSDAGYGLLMMAVCGFLGFSKRLAPEKRSIYKMFFWCGISTTLWGLAYGSFFGDLPGTLSATFGSGNTSLEPILLDPVNQALELLIISVMFGAVHIITALSIRFYSQWRSGNKTEAVCDTGLWIAVLSGAGILAVGLASGSTYTSAAGGAVFAIACSGIVLTAGRDRKNPVMKLFGGLLGLYDITGYIGDLLSYSRLMALGLATGVIASVVNILASLGGNSPQGAVVFILISVIGHSLNFAINMLGAYVHTNRLQYVEFFQKFYRGGGRLFKPLAMETKYFDFTDGKKGNRL